MHFGINLGVLLVIWIFQILHFGIFGRSIRDELHDGTTLITVSMAISSSYIAMLFLSMVGLKLALEHRCFHKYHGPTVAIIILCSFEFVMLFFFFWALTFWPRRTFLGIGSYFLIASLLTSMVLFWLIKEEEKSRKKIEEYEANNHPVHFHPLLTTATNSDIDSTTGAFLQCHNTPPPSYEDSLLPV